MISQGPDNTPAGTRVLLPFKHALSKVSFSVKCDAGYTVYISSLGLHGLASYGKYDFLNDRWSINQDAYEIGEYYDVGLTVDAGTGIQGDVSAYTDVTAANGAIMVIPQTVAAWDKVEWGGHPNLTTGSRIRVVYKIEDTNGTFFPDPEQEEYQTAYLPMAVNFEMGKAYRIELDMKHGGGFDKAGNPITPSYISPAPLPVMPQFTAQAVETDWNAR